MITFQIPQNEVAILIDKLDQVPGTRRIANFFENGLIRSKKQEQPVADKPIVEDNEQQEKENEQQEGKKE